MFLSTILISIILSFPFATLSQSTIPLPTPPGRYNVHISSAELIDHSRADPYAPGQPRRLMISLFQPASCAHTIPIPYMPPAVADFFNTNLILAGIPIPNGTFEAFRLQTCPQGPSHGKSFPLLLFSTGLGTSRLQYSSILQWIASTGFNIAAIDHTYDASIVEFPDGTIITGVNITVNEIPFAVSVRVRDASFVLDALSRPSTHHQLSIPASYPLDTARVGMFGHSLGGATAASAIVEDHRITCGADFDGSVDGPGDSQPSSRPFLLFAAEGHNQTNDLTWHSLWTELRGWKRQLEVAATVHGTFSDYPVLAEVLGFSGTTLPILQPYIGTIEGLRLLDILRTYVGAFFGFALKGQGEGVLKGPSAAFPEVAFRNSSEGRGR